jgi:hypothetical protein
MEKHLIVAAGAAALAFFAVSPSLAGHGKRQSLDVKNADRVQRTAANMEAFRARRRAAIVALCPDNTLSSGQRNCERMARSAADAEPTGVKFKD